MNTNLLNKQYYKIFSHTYLYIKDPLPESLDIKQVLAKVSNTLPKTFLDNVDNIYIGKFDELEQRNVNSVFLDDTLYITNVQTNEKDLIDDIVHEIGHSVEQSNELLIHTDENLTHEFLSKRQEMYNRIIENWNTEIHGNPPDEESFLNPDYDKNIDEFLYKTIGYSNLGVLTYDLFLSPYAATSLSEYFADGFEDFYLKADERKTIQQLCPQLFSVLQQIQDES